MGRYKRVIRKKNNTGKEGQKGSEGGIKRNQRRNKWGRIEVEKEEERKEGA